MQLVPISPLWINSPIVNPPYSHIAIIANTLDIGQASAANLMAINVITVGRSGICKRIAGVKRREKRKRKKRRVQNKQILEKKRLLSKWMKNSIISIPLMLVMLMQMITD